MIKFFATGEYFKDKKEKNKRFVPRLASPGESGRINERNYINQFDYEFKPIVKKEYPRATYSQNFRKHNDNWKEKSYYEQPVSNGSSLHNYQTSYNCPVDPIIKEHYVPCHIQNFRLLKTKSFSKQTQPSITHPSSVIDRNTFEKERGGEDTVIQEVAKEDGLKLPRNHFYISKPLLRINKDFKDQPLIKNVQTLSDDTPDWCQTTNKFYTQDNIDLTKKDRNRLKNQSKTNVLGQVVKDFNKLPDNWRLEPPHSGLRYEVSKMIPTQDPLRRAEGNRDDLKKTRVSLDWREEREKQRYEYHGTSKVGWNEKPFIKALEVKRNDEQMRVKIGQLDVPVLKNKQKPVQIKIGHGGPDLF